MPDYDFKSLSPYDFENLVRDLLQKEFGVTLECFTIGRDDGIDLRYSVDKETPTLIQCKHFAGSGYGKLYSHLKLKELEKVKRMEPKHYILATSVGHTPSNKQNIMKLFDPYISSEKDIYGKGELNNGSSLLHVGRLNWIFPSLRYIISMRFFVVLKPLALLFAD